MTVKHVRAGENIEPGDPVVERDSMVFRATTEGGKVTTITFKLFKPGATRPWLQGNLEHVPDALGNRSEGLNEHELHQLLEVEQAINATVGGRCHVEVTG